MENVNLAFFQFKICVRILRKNQAFIQFQSFSNTDPTDKEIIKLLDNHVDSFLFFDWEKQRKDEKNRGVIVFIYKVFKENPNSVRYYETLFREIYFSPEELSKKLPSIRLRRVFGDKE